MSSHQKQAEARVQKDHQLKWWKDILIEYAWGNYEDHIEWVATGDRDEIIEWCRGIRADERSQRREERRQ